MTAEIAHAIEINVDGNLSRSPEIQVQEEAYLAGLPIPETMPVEVRLYWESRIKTVRAIRWF